MAPSPTACLPTYTSVGWIDPVAGCSRKLHLGRRWRKDEGGEEEVKEGRDKGVQIDTSEESEEKKKDIIEGEREEILLPTMAHQNRALTR